MPKIKLLIVLLVVLLMVGSYAAVKRAQYVREWKEFQDAWQKVSAELEGTPGYSWTPGLYSAVGEMDFSKCRITDEKLAEISAQLSVVASLVKLDLSGSEVTDAGLAHLREMTSLHELYLRDTKVTDEGVKALNETLPNCMIIR